MRVVAAPGLLVRVWGASTVAMTLRRRVFVRPDVLAGPPERLDPVLAHELVHVAQWERLGVAGFLVRYVGSYLRSRLRGLPHTEAYLAIPLEVEARSVRSG